MSVEQPDGVADVAAPAHAEDHKDEAARRETLEQLTVVDVDVHVHEDPGGLADYADPPWDVLEGSDALDWVEAGRAFVDEVERVVREAVSGGATGLWELAQRVNAVLGPYPEFTTELGATVREAASA